MPLGRESIVFGMGGPFFALIGNLHSHLNDVAGIAKYRAKNLFLAENI